MFRDRQRLIQKMREAVRKRRRMRFRKRPVHRETPGSRRPVLQKMQSRMRLLCRNTDPEVLSSDAEDGYPAEDAVCTSREDVAAYIHQYGHLPDNFITKKEAQELGWEGGSLEPYAPGMCIGGNRFGNYEGLLPEKDGRTYTECDIDTLGAGSRGAKRIVFSSDGLIYYTEDHYESFELLYGEEEP